MEGMKASPILAWLCFLFGLLAFGGCYGYLVTYAKTTTPGERHTVELEGETVIVEMPANVTEVSPAIIKALGFGFALPALLLFMYAIIGKLPKALVNCGSAAQNEYWKRPENYPQALAKARRLLLYFGALTSVWMGLQCLSFLENSPLRMYREIWSPLLLIFSTAILIWIGVRSFRIPKEQ